jgi:hypothetical protein
LTGFRSCKRHIYIPLLTACIYPLAIVKKIAPKGAILLFNFMITS